MKMDPKIEELCSELLQCAVCLGEISNPRSLECLHSFCERCIQTHANNYRQTRATSTNYFPCPSCRVLTLLPTEGVRGLKKDFRLEKIGHVLRNFVSSTSTAREYEHVCNICSSALNIRREATKYCTDCCKTLCSSCVQTHHRKAPLVSHVLMELPRRSTIDNINANGRKTCAVHRKEDEKYFCIECDRKLCIACLSIHDDNHKVTRQTSLDNSASVNVIIQNVQDQHWNIHEAMFSMTVLEGKLKTAYEESKLSVKKQSRKYMAKLMAEENKLLKSLDQIYKDRSEKLLNHKEVCKTQLEEVENLQARIHFLLMLEDGKDKVLEVYPSLHDKVQTLQTMLQSLETNLDIVADFIKFVPAQPNAYLGTVEKRTLKEPRPVPSQNTEARVVAPGQQSSSSALSLSMLTDVIEPFFPEDNSVSSELPMVTEPIYNPRLNAMPSVNLLCRFGNCGSRIGEFSLPYNLCFLRDDTIAVGDLGNKRIQIVDKFGHCQKIIAQGEIGPRTVTTTTDGFIAATDELDKTVKVFSSNGDLLTNVRMDTLSFPYGIAATSEKNFVVTDMIYESITIISSMGRVILRFGSHGRADNCLDNPGCLYVDGDDTIYVSDTGNHCVKVFNKNGRFLYKIGSYGEGNGQLKYPKAVCTDGKGHLFVADSGNDRIVAFTMAGSFLGTVISRSSGLKRPTGLSCSSAGQLLAVSLPDIGEIRVYEISDL